MCVLVCACVCSKGNDGHLSCDNAEVPGQNKRE